MEGGKTHARKKKQELCINKFILRGKWENGEAHVPHDVHTMHHSMYAQKILQVVYATAQSLVCNSSFLCGVVLRTYGLCTSQLLEALVGFYAEGHPILQIPEEIN
jgi:hypothetical protein